MPPATLTLLLTSLGTQALMSLGQIPNPMNKAEVNRDHAERCIDLIGMLEEDGRRPDTERSQLLEELLYELRMLFLQSENRGEKKFQVPSTNRFQANTDGWRRPTYDESADCPAGTLPKLLALSAA